MTEYIERDVLLEKLNQEACDCEFMRLLSDIPAADVAPVVHCRDCVYNGLDSMPHTKDKCYRLMLTCFAVKPEDFCAWGRKKDGE